MDILVDTNILLDVLQKREPHYGSSAAIWTLCEQGKLRGHISVISFNNIYYIVRKLADKNRAKKSLTVLRGVFIPTPLDAQVLNQAIDAGLRDFEDAIQYQSALWVGAQYLLTRNVSHFPKGALPIITPAEFLATVTLP